MLELNIWITALVGFIASFFGAMLGIGGGVLIVPVLTLILNIPVHVAISSSLITIIANASTASIIYLLNHMTNIRIGLLITAVTIPGAIAGSLLADRMSSELIIILFSLILIIVAVLMLFPGKLPLNIVYPVTSTSKNIKGEDRWQGTYFDRNINKYIPYKMKKIPLGSGFSFFGGIISTMFGIGGGVIYVPLMHLVLGIPIKAAIATSTLIIAITTASGAIINYYNGYVQPALVVPLIIGAIIGSRWGSITSLKVKPKVLQIIFFIIMLLISATMFLKALGII